MKKLVSILLILVTLCTCFAIIPGAMADSASGSTASTKTFTIRSYCSPGAYFVISSSTGLAKVAQHNWLGRYTGLGNEKTYGFYKVSIKGPKANESFIWAPSATTNKKNVSTCQEIRIKLPSIGNYKITIAPLSPSAAAKYWRVDSIKKWVHHATWHVTILNECKII